METLTITQFIAVIIPLTGGVSAALYILFGRIADLRAELVKSKEHLSLLATDNRDLQEDYSKLESNRNKDLLDFTKILGGINVTLTKVEGTLHHLEETVQEIKKVIEEIRKK